MVEWLKRWYEGRTEVTEFENDPNSYIHVLPLVTTDYHWTTKVARALVSFYLKHWQWIWGTALAVAGLYLALLQLRQSEGPKETSEKVAAASGKQLVARTASSPSQMLVGTWKGVANHGSLNEGGLIVISGYMQLLSSGGYNFSGEIEFQSKDGAALQFTALAAGTWKPTDNGFILTAEDVKTTPRALKQPGTADKDLVELASQFPRHAFPRMEDSMPKGASQQYEMLELSSTHLRAKSNDARGSVVTYEAVRQ